MVSVRKRKMARSSVKKQKKKEKSSNSKFNPKANPIIAKYWDSNLTAKQNYTKLGLRMTLGTATGGIEKKLKIPEIKKDNELENLEDEEDEDEDEDDENEGEDAYNPANILKGTAKIQRDSDGNVLRIVYGSKEITEEIETEQDLKDKDHADLVISELEAMAQRPKKEVLYKLNSVEVSRLQRLERKYKDNYQRMQWDQKLNPFQLSAGELKKKFAILQKQLAAASASLTEDQ